MELNKVQFWPAQKDFFESGPSPILFFGGVGSGKTYIGILRLLYLLDQYPGSRGAIVRQRFQQLKKTTAATLWKLLPRDQIRSKNENDGTVRLKNGSEIVLLHLDKTDSINNLKSLEINFAYVDQLEDLSVDAWDTLIERVGRWSGATKRGGWPKKWPYRNRLGDPIPPRYVFASAYSPGYEHWITARWWEHGIEREKYRKKGYRVVFGSTRENLALSQEYVDDRLAMGSEYVRRFVDAQEWGANEGRIFTLDSMSILEPSREFFEYMRRRMKLHRVYDHGDFSPAACLWYATDAHGNVFFYREYQQKDKLVSEHRRAIFELSKDDGFGATGPNYYSNLADPIIFAKSRGRTTTAGPSWCLSPETPILTADLRHVPVKDLMVGDLVAGFDEGEVSETYSNRGERQPERRWREAIVTNIGLIKLPSYKITLSDGTSVTSSSDHLWLTNPTGSWRLWRKTKDLKVGQRLLRATEVWGHDMSNGGGYLAAAFDGEGFLTLKEYGTFRTGFSQCDNPMLDRVRRELYMRGFRPSENIQASAKNHLGHRPITHLTIGHRSEVMRLLGSIRPDRLLPKFDFNKIGRVHVIAKPEIVSIEYVGEQDVVTIGTSTRTLIASGLMSHNSVADEWLDRRLIEPETAVYWRPADNNEEMTISRVKEYLRVDPRHKHPITGKYGAPRVYFIRKTDEYPNGLDQTIIDIRAAKRIEVGQDANGNKLYSDKRDDKVPDHCLDCVRYSLAGRPALARLVNEAPLEPGTMRFSDYEKMTRTDNFYAERKQQEDRRRPYGSGW